jgi:rhodanese-related sulfurtransferase
MSSMLKKDSVPNLDSESFRKGFSDDSKAEIIDVRTPAEHEEARIPNSKLIDIMSPDFNEEIQKLDKEKSYYVYCRSGNRSYYAAKAMKKIGIEKVYNLADGIIGWDGEIEN